MVAAYEYANACHRKSTPTSISGWMLAVGVERHAPLVSGIGPDETEVLMNLSDRYGVRLRVRGELGPAWSAVFADLAVEPEPDGTTIIRGEVRDQAALYGLLAAIRDLGLSLISIATIAAPDS
jgi:hypothetical protein